MKKHPRYIKAVLFDFDGTLTRPDSLDLSIIKKQIGCPSGSLLLEYIATLPQEQQRRKALEAVDEFELAAAAEAKPNTGAEDLVRFLHDCGVRIGIVTRNSRPSVLRALANFRKVTVKDFDLIITRDDPINPKPSGDGIQLAARRLKVTETEMLMVGDYPMDIEAGNRAGAFTVLLANPHRTDSSENESDFSIDQLSELMNIVRMGLPLPGGKLPNDLLAQFLSQFGFEDPAVLIKPAIGEDTAAVDIRGEEVLVLKSDPITFASEAIAKYAVLVNANDVATAGAVPRWFLTTLMFPVGTSAYVIHHVMEELSEVCRSQGITLCGGHTEITDAVARPVVTGMMVGTVERRRLIDKRYMKPGDKVLMTKAVAVEGTAIIAREFSERLVSGGMSPSDIDNCGRFLDNISILPEASIAASVDGVSAMHDVTEGGLATALEELSIAGGHRIRVETDRIPVYPETEKICGLLKLDPLGLIGSGSLLICCRQYACDTLEQNIRRVGIAVSIIGEVCGAGSGIEALREHRTVPWPHFEVDEITRLFRPS
jgi:HAD superfamily hydrolase (TIGR01509 family)